MTVQSNSDLCLDSDRTSNTSDTSGTYVSNLEEIAALASLAHHSCEQSAITMAKVVTEPMFADVVVAPRLAMEDGSEDVSTAPPAPCYDAAVSNSVIAQVLTAPILMPSDFSVTQNDNVMTQNDNVTVTQNKTVTPSRIISVSAIAPARWLHEEISTQSSEGLNMRARVNSFVGNPVPNEKKIEQQVIAKQERQRLTMREQTKNLHEIQERIAQRPLFGSLEMNALMKRHYYCSEAQAVNQAIEDKAYPHQKRLTSTSCEQKRKLLEIQKRIDQRPLFDSSHMDSVMKQHFYSKTEGPDGFDRLEMIAAKDDMFGSMIREKIRSSAHAHHGNLQLIRDRVARRPLLMEQLSKQNDG